MFQRVGALAREVSEIPDSDNEGEEEDGAPTTTLFDGNLPPHSEVNHRSIASTPLGRSRIPDPVTANDSDLDDIPVDSDDEEDSRELRPASLGSSATLRPPEVEFDGDRGSTMDFDDELEDIPGGASDDDEGEGADASCGKGEDPKGSGMAATPPTGPAPSISFPPPVIPPGCDPLNCTFAMHLPRQQLHLAYFELARDWKNLKLFLEANGQNFSKMKGLSSYVRKPLKTVKEEKYEKTGGERRFFAQYARADGETPWETLKNTVIEWDSETYENPYDCRLECSGKDTERLREYIRNRGRCLLAQSCPLSDQVLAPDIDCAPAADELIHPLAIEDGGWDPAAVAAHERAILESAPESIRKHLQRSVSTTLDQPARVLFYSQHPKLFDVNVKANGKHTSRAFDAMMFPADLRQTNPTNFLWFRCADLSPAHPWRDIQSQPLFEAHCTVFTYQYRDSPILKILQEIRHGFSHEKGNYRDGATAHAPGVQTGSLAPTWTKAEQQFYNAVVPQRLRKLGMHVWASQPENQARLKEELAHRKQEALEQAELEGKDPPPFMPFFEANAVKVKWWSELTKEERQSWRDRVKDLPGKEIELSQYVGSSFVQS